LGLETFPSLLATLQGVITDNAGFAWRRELRSGPINNRAGEAEWMNGWVRGGARFAQLFEAGGASVNAVEVVVESDAQLLQLTKATIVVMLEDALLALRGSKFVVALDLSRWNVERLAENFAPVRALAFVIFSSTVRAIKRAAFVGCESVVRESLSCAVGLRKNGRRSVHEKGVYLCPRAGK
jgi:hypothetical protein